MEWRHDNELDEAQIAGSGVAAVRQPIFLQSLVAGGIAGTIVDISLFPIDTLKTRLQSSQGFAASGGFRGVYAGIGSAVVGSAPGAALFFVTYEGVKAFLSQVSNGERSASFGSEPLQHMVAGSLGEIAACAVRVPTEVIKQRAQASQHASSLSALRHILAQRVSGGLAAVWMELYRGWSITIFREVPFTAIQFPLWEALKKRRARQMGHETNTAAESALFGCFSGAVAAAATTPLDVLKTRMMLAKDKQRLMSLAWRIMQAGGPRAFFAGVGPRVAWISAGGAVFLGSYQWASNALAVLS